MVAILWFKGDERNDRFSDGARAQMHAPHIRIVFLYACIMCVYAHVVTLYLAFADPCNMFIYG